MDRNEYPIALSIDDQYFLSQLLLGVPCDVDPEQVSRLFAEGLIERTGKRWKLSAAGRAYLGEGPSSTCYADHARLRAPPSGDRWLSASSSQ